MADTTALKNRIRAAIKANDNQEITGPVLQQALLDIVDELSDRIIDEYAFIGIAVPTTIPPSDLTEYSRVFYLTAQNGIYTNLGGIEVSNEIAAIKYNGTSWVKDTIIAIDDEPIAGSDNLVKSGGVDKDINRTQDLILANRKNDIEIIISENNQDVITSEISDNIATVTYDYQSGSGWKIFAVKIGKVKDLKDVITYLYSNATFSEYYITKNNPYSFSEQVTGWNRSSINGGYKFELPLTMFDNLNDDDVLYMVTGANYHNDKVLQYFISNTDLDAYDTTTINRIDRLENNTQALISDITKLNQETENLDDGVIVKRSDILAVPGQNSSDYITCSSSDNLENISVDYQSGSGFVLYAIRIGTVAELKKKTHYLYLNGILLKDECYVTKNRTISWSTDTVDGWIIDSITNGYRVTFPTSMFDGLLDTDIIYFLNGINSYITIDIEAFIASVKLYEYNTGKYLTDENAQAISTLNLRNIVCWGDSLTAGVGGIPYSAFIKEKLPNYNVINCGVGGETISTIMARQGSDVGLIPYDIQLPASNSQRIMVADGTQEQYFTSALDGKIIAPLIQGAGGQGRWSTDSVNPCWINGIKCNLVKAQPATIPSQMKWLLQRVDDGDRTITIPANTPIMLSGESKYGQPKAVIFFAGENGGFDDDDDLIMKLKRMAEQANTSKYIVVGTYTSVQLAKEAALQSAFGSHYFNSRVYLSTNAIYDIGLTPTETDLSLMAQGLIPKTFWNTNSDNVHMNSYGYKALGYMLANILKSFGL